MKSRTSFFNGPVFRKNMTRFAPLWGGYTVCLLLGMILLMDGGNMDFWFAANLATMCSGMAVINLGYALLTAQILFGDLYNTRMCNGLHAMPLTRECWYTTHVVSGIAFSLIPTLIMTVAAEPIMITMSSMVNGWQIPLYFLLSSNLEYLLFFGIAVLCVMSAGNRVGMAVLYAIVNFLSYLVYFLVDSLITPMYYGVITMAEPFSLFCPVAQLCQEPLITCEQHKVLDSVSPAGNESYNMYGTFELTEHWGYLVIVAVLGVVLLVLARQLYRRRKLECAGDFLATGKLAPVFMVIFSVTMGAVFHFAQSLFVGYSTLGLPVMLLSGTVIGWFVGRMLLERQTRVFRSGKNWLGVAVLLAVLTGGLYGLSLDPFGVEDWVPQPEDIRSVTVVNGYRGTVETEDPGEIADMLAIHRHILEEKLTGAEAEDGYVAARAEAMELPEVVSGKASASTMAEKIGYRRYANIRITYELKNGWKVSRDYWMWLDTEEAALANSYFSRVEAVFYHQEKINSADDLLAAARTPEYFYLDQYVLPEEYLTEEMVYSLLEAVVADCAAGNLTQDRAYHKGFVVDTENHIQQYFRIDIGMPNQDIYFDIYADSEHCMQWLEDTGLRDYIMSMIGPNAK